MLFNVELSIIFFSQARLIGMKIRRTQNRMATLSIRKKSSRMQKGVQNAKQADTICEQTRLAGKRPSILRLGTDPVDNYKRVNTSAFLNKLKHDTKCLKMI